MTNEQKALTIPVFSPELQAKIDEFKKEWYQHYKRISKQKTPTYDGQGRQIVKRRPDSNFDYIVAPWMRDKLNHYFPGWSWRRTAPTYFIGSEWAVIDGELCIIDERLLAFSINPPYRYFAATGAARIQFKSGQPHTPENVALDINYTVSSANTRAFKKAINELLSIGDDIYKWRVDEEGAGSLEDIIASSNETSSNVQSRAFGEWLSKKRVPVGEALRTLNIKSLQQITDYKQAQEAIAKEKGL